MSKKKKHRDSVTRTHTTGYFWCDAVVLALAVTIDFPRLPPEEDKHAGTCKQLNRQTTKREFKHSSSSLLFRFIGQKLKLDIYLNQ
jgi:hypothetical protein